MKQVHTGTRIPVARRGRRPRYSFNPFNSFNPRGNRRGGFRGPLRLLPSPPDRRRGSEAPCHGHPESVESGPVPPMPRSRSIAQILLRGARRRARRVFKPDNLGNVVAHADAGGSVVAAYAYDAFGRTASASGPLAATFAHRLSTKPLEAETDLCFFCKTIHLSPCLYDANVFESCVAGLSSMSPSPNYHAPYYDCRTWARHRIRECMEKSRRDVFWGKK